ncbi:GmrSD restriction endonuclease domain-containing protein [Arthrobacter zhaoxinii]|uniref:GmrSD restriction endonuclease domain-containing protein n=1 Tax=Arthrobacter zhaoxinii TaxID=2964616 RepID=UPI002107C4DC|nr:DUF1524 domain-containing protein [Arthrobacter zhaoxinii]MCQ2000706.1 DUF1524 domain-containing protein [Arthrobacter zhaoxinii]
MTDIKPTQKRKLGSVTIVTGSILGLLVIAAMFPSVTAGLGLLAFCGLLTGLYVLITGRRSWARLPAGRRGGAIAVAASVVTLIVASALAPASELDAPSLASDPAPTSSPSASTSPTAAPSSEPEPTPVNASEPELQPEADAPAPEPEPTPVTASEPEPQPEAAAPAPAAVGTALAQLDTIPIKGRAPKTGYDRDQFGPAWKDVDRNGCDQRNDLLLRDLESISFKPGTNNCVVTSGTLLDPFTGSVINFVRGEGTSNAVQIDHVVALSDAWQKGAQQMGQDQREAFANDPLNLLAVDGSSNGAKGDGDAATWLPPNKGFRCEYVALQTAVKAKYGLWMTQAESDAIRNILTSTCPDQPVPTDGGVMVAPEPAPAAEPLTVEAPAPAPAPLVDVYYPNCDAVKAAGAAPIRAGDPGWQSKFDRDGDGVGCEN